MEENCRVKLPPEKNGARLQEGGAGLLIHGVEPVHSEGGGRCCHAVSNGKESVPKVKKKQTKIKKQTQHWG